MEYWGERGVGGEFKEQKPNQGDPVRQINCLSLDDEEDKYDFEKTSN